MDGILLVDKQKGWTSHDVVAKVRSIIREAQKQGLNVAHLDVAQGDGEKQSKSYKKYDERVSEPATQRSAKSSSGVASSASEQAGAVRKIKVGHAGTLDPLATGLLIILVGSYCKRAQEFTKLNKTYEVSVKLGQTSTTGDEEGKKAKISSKQPTLNEIKAILGSFTGEIEQVPPIYSALKVNGQRAYKLARAGKAVELKPRHIIVYNLQITDYKYPLVKFTCKVSSGTYVRSLARDIGIKSGAGAYMMDLNRVQIGKYNLATAINELNFDSIQNNLLQ